MLRHSPLYQVHHQRVEFVEVSFFIHKQGDDMLLELLADYWWLAIITAILCIGEYAQWREVREISNMLDGKEHDWP